MLPSEHNWPAVYLRWEDIAHLVTFVTAVISSCASVSSLVIILTTLRCVACVDPTLTDTSIEPAQRLQFLVVLVLRFAFYCRESDPSVLASSIYRCVHLQHHRNLPFLSCQSTVYLQSTGFTSLIAPDYLQPQAEYRRVAKTRNSDLSHRSTLLLRHPAIYAPGYTDFFCIH